MTSEVNSNTQEEIKELQEHLWNVVIDDLVVINAYKSRSDGRPFVTLEALPQIVAMRKDVDPVCGKDESAVIAYAKKYVRDSGWIHRHYCLSVIIEENTDFKCRYSAEIEECEQRLVQTLFLYVNLLEKTTTYCEREWYTIKGWFESQDWLAVQSEAEQKLKALRATQGLGGKHKRKPICSLEVHSYRSGIFEIIVREKRGNILYTENATTSDVADKSRSLFGIFVSSLNFSVDTAA